MENIIPIAHTRIISTHALTEGDALVREFSIVHDISTHALTEGDAPGLCLHIPPAHFNSRPHGGRLFCVSIQIHLFFISTHALTEGDVCKVGRVRNFLGISTHALTEGDGSYSPGRTRRKNFNSRPHGGRQVTGKGQRYFVNISTHALTEGDCVPYMEPFCKLISTHALTEGDRNCIYHEITICISTHALTEGDQRNLLSIGVFCVFQLTPSRRATGTHRRSAVP